jgi:hypothetical protein
MRRGVGGGVTDHRLGDDEAEVRARDRISALAHGFRILSENLDRRYRRVARMCVASAAISLVTLLGTVLIERRTARRIRRRGSSARRRTGSVSARRSTVPTRIRSRRGGSSRRSSGACRSLTARPTRAVGRRVRSLGAAARFRATVRGGRLTLREQGICRDRLPRRPTSRSAERPGRAGASRPTFGSTRGFQVAGIDSLWLPEGAHWDLNIEHHPLRAGRGR